MQPSLLAGWGTRRNRGAGGKEDTGVRSERPGKRGHHEWRASRAAGAGLGRSHVVCHVGQTFGTAPHGSACCAHCAKCPSSPSYFRRAPSPQQAPHDPATYGRDLQGHLVHPERRLSCPRTPSPPREPRFLDLGCLARLGDLEQGLWHPTKLEPQVCRLGAVAGKLFAQLR